MRAALKRIHTLTKGFMVITVFMMVFSLFMPLLPIQADTAAPTTTTYEATDLPFDPMLGRINERTSPYLSTIVDVYLGDQDPLTVTIRIVNILLTFLGSAFLLLLIYAGFQWAWARGNTEQIEKAKNLLKRAIIGFIITLAAMGISITVFVITQQYTTSQFAPYLIPNLP